MSKHTPMCQYRTTALSGALVLLMLYSLLSVLAPGATAEVGLLYFTATPQGNNSILVTWETASEVGTVAFNLYRSQDAGSQGQQIGDTFPVQGGAVSGAQYLYNDTNITSGVRYYYTLEEVTNTGGLVKVATTDAGIDMPTLTPTSTATATATRTATATHTPPAPNAPGSTSGDQPTATRQFTLTPRPLATAAAGSTQTPPPPAPATATPIGVAVVSRPTGGPQPPIVAPTALPATMVPTPLPPEPSTLPASPSPAVVAMSTVQPVEDVTPTITPSPQVFAAATAQPVLGTPGRTRADPTPVPADPAARTTGSIFLLGGGAILLAAVIGGGVLLYLRSRKS